MVTIVLFFFKFMKQIVILPAWPCVCNGGTVHVQILRGEWKLNHGLSRFEVYFSKKMFLAMPPPQTWQFVHLLVFIKQFQDWCVDETSPVQLVLLTKSADRCCRWRILPSFNWSVNAVMDSTSVLYSEGLAEGNILVNEIQ